MRSRTIVTLALSLLVLLLTAASCGTTTTEPGTGLVVGISSPSQDVSTNGVVNLQVVVTGGVSDEVQLLRGESVLVVLESPFSFAWDTTGEPEGAYEIRARATANGLESLSDVRLVTVDRTAPTVLSRVPSPGSGNTSVDARFEVRFSEPLLAGTVSDSTVIVTDGGGAVLEKLLSVSSSAQDLALVLSSVPSVPNSVSVTLTSGITDRAGNALVVPASPWSVELPEWFHLGGAVSANAGTTPASRPSLALDEDGNPVVAWDEFDGSAQQIYVQRWTGASWEALGGALSAGPAVRPSLALDGTGNPTVAWQESGKIFVQRWNGTSWVVRGNGLSAKAGTTSSRPSLVLDAAGEPVVAWDEGSGDDLFIHVQRLVGRTWEPLGGGLSANAGATAAVRPSLALSSTGDPFVAWDEFDGSAFNIHVQRWTGSGWEQLSGAQSTNSGPTDALSPSLQVNAVGNPVVAWDEPFAGVNDVYVRGWNGSSWLGAGGPISANPDSTNALFVSLRLNEGGDPVIAWQEPVASSGSRIFVWRWTGADWESLADGLSANGGIRSAVAPSLALDANGIPLVAWSESDGVTIDIHVMKYNQ